MQLLDRTAEISKLLVEKSRVTENKEFFNSLNQMSPKSLFYAIADLPQNFANAEQKLEGEEYQNLSIFSCNMSLLTVDGLTKFLDLLMPAVCCYDSSHKSLLMLTCSEDREDVTNDSIDSAFYELLPKIGYGGDHSLAFTRNSKDYVLAIASRNVSAAPVGFLAVMIALCEGTDYLCIESSISKGTAKVPITPTEIQAICGNGATKSVKHFKLSKAFLDITQQSAFKSARGKIQVHIDLDRVELERDTNGQVPLLEPDPAMGGPLFLLFEGGLNVRLDELADAIHRGRVGNLGFEGFQLAEGQEAQLKTLLRVARDKRCPVSLRTLTHQRMSEQELLDYFQEDGVAPDAFSEAAPEIATDDDFVPVDNYKIPDYNIFGCLPDDLMKCEGCNAIFAKTAQCGSCHLPDAPTSTKPSQGTIGNTGAAPGATPGGGFSFFSFPQTSTGVSAPGATPGSGFSFSTSTGASAVPGVTTGGGFSFSQPSATTSVASGGFSFSQPGTGNSGGEFSMLSTGGPTPATTGAKSKATPKVAASSKQEPAAITTKTTTGHSSNQRRQMPSKTLGRQGAGRSQSARSLGGQVENTPRRMTRSQSDRQVLGEGDHGNATPLRRSTRLAGQRDDGKN